MRKRLVRLAGGVLAVGVLMAGWRGTGASLRQAATPYPQQQTGTGPVVPHQHNGDMDSDNPMKERQDATMMQRRNSERQKRLVDDTARLLQLSTELKAEVDKTTKNEMSLDVIKKAAEIEKLAHDVKERMKGQ